MGKTVLLALVVVLTAPAVSAREIRHDAVPEAFWGTWAPGADACKEKAAPAIVLAKKAYAGPAGSCDIDYVTEIPGRNGPIYSARMRCAGSGATAKKTANLIIRPEDAGQAISAGPTFESLVAYRRCAVGNQ